MSPLPSASSPVADISADGAGELALSRLSWRPASRRRPTIDGLTVNIPAGQRVLLAGASGSGKSTVLRALAGLLDASTGDLDGTLHGPSRPGARALLLQQPLHALVGASIGRDAAFGPENIAADRAEIQHRVSTALRSAEVDLDADAVPLDASGGQQQRIALGGSLALTPDALLLDEPTSMLDEAAAGAVRAAVLSASEGRTLVVADHVLGPWLQHVDRLIVLGEQSRILVDGPPEVVRREHGRLMAELGIRIDAAASPTSTPSAVVPESADPAAATSLSPVAALADLAIRRRGPDGAVIARDLQARLAAGSLTVITGPSGAGKTTALRVLLGLEDPAAGTVVRPRPSEIAFVPQQPEHSFVAGTVRDEVLASPWASDPDLAGELLEAADLSHLERANPFTLSGGEQRRLALVAALAQQPRLLVLDEPTVGLDARRAEAVLALLDRARARGCAVIAATHDAQLVARADRALRIGGQEAAPQEATTPASPAVPETTIRPVPRRRPVLSDTLNPLTACLIGILAAVGSFAVDHWMIGLLALIPVLVLAPLTMRSARGTALRLLPIAASALGLAWSTILLSPAPILSSTAWLLGLQEGLRITLFVAPGVLVMGSIDPTALGDALGGRLRLPGRPVAASVIGLVRAGHTSRQWDVILTARRLRGLGPDVSWRHPWRSLRGVLALLGSATFALLVDAIRGAQGQSLAMDARGFAGAHHRSWALPSRFTRADLIGALIAVLLLAGPWLIRLLLS